MTLMNAMIELRQGDALAEAYVEAWERGPAWKEAISESLQSFDPEGRKRVQEGLTKGMRNIGAYAHEFAQLLV